jgi:EpsI family protein
MMHSERLKIVAMIVALVAVGVISWQFQLRKPPFVDTSNLARIPMLVDDWRGEDIPLQDGVQDMLDADYNLQRVYQHRVGGRLWFYVGYYGTKRGGRPEHTPWQCYPSNGWTIVSNEILGGSPEVPRLHELVVEKDGRRRLVHFWFQSSRRGGMLGALDQAADRLVNRILHGRADGSLVRLSLPLPDERTKPTARNLLLSFGRSVTPLLMEYWPNEGKAS